MQTPFGLRRRSSSTVFVLGDPSSTTNRRLRDAFGATGLPALVASAQGVSEWARHGDIVLGRLDVRPTLDGVQPGLARLLQVRDRGIRVVNDAHSLIASHDKLATMLLLQASGRPAAAWSASDGRRNVAKFRAAVRGETPIRELGARRSPVRVARRAAHVPACDLRPALVPPPRRAGPGADPSARLRSPARRLRGRGRRRDRAVAAPGEWRTNIALGGHRRRTTPSAEACALAARAAAAIGGDLVGVDLLPDDGGWRVIEINGAVDFTDEYALDGGDVFARAVEPLVEGTAVEVRDHVFALA